MAEPAPTAPSTGTAADGAAISAFATVADTVTIAPPPGPETPSGPAPAAPAPADAAVSAAPPAPVARDRARCLPPPTVFSRLAVPAIALALAALAWSTWIARGELAAVDRALIPAVPPMAPPPSADDLLDEARYAALEDARPGERPALRHARALALASRGRDRDALAAWSAIGADDQAALPVAEAVARAGSLSAMQRWDAALAQLDGLDLARADASTRARAIALAARCRLALRHPQGLEAPAGESPAAPPMPGAGAAPATPAATPTAIVAPPHADTER